MAMDWKLALPLHLNRTCRGLVSPITRFSLYADAGEAPKSESVLPPSKAAYSVQYLANMLSASDTGHDTGTSETDGDAPYAFWKPWKALPIRAVMIWPERRAQVEGYRLAVPAETVCHSSRSSEMAGDAFAERNGCGFTLQRRCQAQTQQNSTCSTVARIDAISITEVRDKGQIMQISK